MGGSLSLRARGATVSRTNLRETTTLRGIFEIRSYFGTNQTPVYFVSPPAFN